MLIYVEWIDSIHLGFVPIFISFYFHFYKIFLIWGHAGLYTSKLLSA